jgi:RNA polymerase sigma factor (sigma-70 family)
MELLPLLAARHNDWVNMAYSFGLRKEDAEDLVQDMYIKMYNFSSAEKIQYNDDINTFYVYITMRNLFYDRKKQEVPTTDIDTLQQIPEEEEGNDKAALEVLLDRMSQCLENQHWYDRKMFEIYYGNGETIRELSKGSKISSSSIFNTIKNVRETIKEYCKEEYKDYKKK